MRASAIRRILTSSAVLSVAILLSATRVRANGAHRAVVPPRARVLSNPNTARAGSMHGDTLSVTLEAQVTSSGRPDGEQHPSMTNRSLRRAGKSAARSRSARRRQARHDHPILRPEFARERRSPSSFLRRCAARTDRMDAMDSVVVAPGAVGDHSTTGVMPGQLQLSRDHRGPDHEGPRESPASSPAPW